MTEDLLKKITQRDKVIKRLLAWREFDQQINIASWTRCVSPN